MTKKESCHLKRHYDLRVETPERRDKKKRYPLREMPKRKENSDGKKNPKQIWKKRPLDEDTKGGNKGEGSPKEKPELPLFLKRRKKDDLDQYISFGLTKPGTVPVRGNKMSLDQSKKNSSTTVLLIGNGIPKRSTLNGSRSNKSWWITQYRQPKKIYEMTIDSAKKERQHAIKLFENEFKFVHMTTIRSLKYNE